MKLVLVQPYYFNIWEALGLAYVGAHVRAHYQGALDLQFFQGYFDSDESVIAGAAGADVVGFSCTSPAYHHALTLARAIKAINPRVRTVFGGFHPSAVPSDCLEEDAIDQVVVGEGEDALLRILDGDRSRIVTGVPFDGLSSLYPDRALIRNERTIDLCQEMVGQRITSFQSVRGCPLRCTFCAERVVTGLIKRRTNPVRNRDARHLLDEIAAAAEDYRLSHFKFVDATWNASPEGVDKVFEFCEEKIRRGFRLPWDANLHAAFVTREMLQVMRRANCTLINVGCESGSQRILHDMKKGLTLDKIRDTFRWGRELGLERRAYFLLGMPNETAADIALTEQLVEEIQPDVFGVTILCPYPGTDHYDPRTMRRYDWSVTDEYFNPYWSTAHFTNAELEEWQARLTRKFSVKLAWHHRYLEANAAGRTGVR